MKQYRKPPVTKKNGTYHVRIPTPSGKPKWLDLETEDWEEAMRMLAESPIDQLVAMATAKALTPKVVSILVSGGRHVCGKLFSGWKSTIASTMRCTSANDYALVVNKFIKEFGLSRKSPHAVKLRHVYEFVNSPLLKKSRCSFRRSALISFFDFCQHMGAAYSNPARLVRVDVSKMDLSRIETKPAESWTEDEFKTFVAHPSVPEDVRHIATLCFRLGLRSSDAGRLEANSLTHTPGHVVLWTKKTGTRISIDTNHPMIKSADLDETIASLIEASKSDPDRSKYVFPRFRRTIDLGNGSQFRAVLARHIKRAGLKRSTHGWRHAFKERVLNSGMSIYEIAKHMGHISIFTTMAYGNGLVSSQRQEAPHPVEVPQPESGEPETDSIEPECYQGCVAQ